MVNDILATVKAYETWVRAKRGFVPPPLKSCSHTHSRARVPAQKFTVCESRERGGKASYARTKTLKNQLVVHALCLALVLEGCRLEFEVLAQDLKLAAAEARAMLRELVRFLWRRLILCAM